MLATRHRLNQCFGHCHGLSHMKTLEMKVTWVDSMSATYPDLTFPLDVDNPDIDKFLIDNRCFDIKTKDTK